MWPVVLKGYAPDEVNPVLRFCDSITIIPDSVNVLTAYDGSMDGRVWVQILDPKVEVPRISPFFNRLQIDYTHG